MNNEAVAERELSVVTWKDVRADVLSVNKELGEIIDAINPGNDYKFVKASYLYGDVFVKKGEAQFPVNNDLAPLSHHSIDKKIQTELLYSPMPLLLMLNKNNEFFFDTGKRDVPINLFHKGSLSGTYEAMDYMMNRKPMPIWNFAAGSRSILMLPKIADKFGLRKLRTVYDIPATDTIKQLSDHWEVFRSIAQSKNFTQHWQSTVLFFGKKWLDNKDCSKEWEQFRNYLLHTIWDHAHYAIDKIKFNIYWESFSRIISARRLQPKPYLIDQVKHLLSIVVGNFPAFTVMDDSQESAPTKCLQQAFTEVYELKEYLPTLMHACMSQDSVIKPNYVYYSLSIPTILEGSPIKKTSNTIVSDLREIKLLIETLKNQFKPNANFEINKFAQGIKIDYFHYKKDECNQIRASDDIPLEDNSFLKDREAFPERDFCPNSPFFSGCIRIETAYNKKDKTPAP
ncbi:MAG: hypothetical protein ACD_21C00035G0005 [uncultured bacterium]|nr:MAG: hypothetical protein ACD_21C00035G0005 [uncultured bacterium]